MIRRKKTVRASQSENDNMNNQIEWYDKNYSDEVSIPLKNTQYITFTFPSTFSFSPQLNAMLSRINNIYIEATKTKREMENIHIPRYLIIMFWLCVVLFISFLIVSTVMKTKMIKIYISFLLLGIITALLLVITIWNYNYKDPPLKMYDEIFCELVKKEIEKINEEFYNNELTKMNKKVLAIYTLFMNNDMKELSLDNEYMDINYVNLITQKQWVYFFWEKGYIE